MLVEKLEPHTLLIGMQNGLTTLESHLVIPQRFNHFLKY
jgi:hypothetical protein